ncbi:MAG: GFA family protein [Deltaproteobacteria bacterium]|nr:GFA family protein [Deltaproteobacteria bacterium]MBW2360997.1 GFA family protein [Deltaproteobacteria bacterium]
MASGSCLCGEVRFAFDGEASVQLCHATRCQKATGSAFAAEIAVAPERFRWLAGEELVQTWTAPLLERPPAYQRSLCRVCGGPTPLLHPEVPWVGILAGSLDEAGGVRATHHAFLDQRAQWLSEGEDGLPRYGMRPPRP